MRSNKLPVGSYVRIEKGGLQALLDKLRALGYRTLGPQVSSGAVIYGELASAEDLPRGLIDEQDGGKYRLRESAAAGYFDYVVGPHSLKRFLFPARETVLSAQRDGQRWTLRPAPVEAAPLAVIGPRSCDLHAVRVLDRVLLGDRFLDPAYQARRENLFVVAVNCRNAAATCFCHSMKTGPAVTFGFDLALTELHDRFIVEVGSEAGGHVVTACDWHPGTIQEITAAREQPEQLRRQMAARASQHVAGEGPRPRQLDTADLHDLLLNHLEHERWEETGRRCLACGNCTLVCPTCFCSDMEEVADLRGERAERQRVWASCFTADHSYMNSGTVRKSTAARYRQWLTHKLASWLDQFGVSGCVGCGRCITWCPVGIDLTEEVAAIRGTPS